MSHASVYGVCAEADVPHVVRLVHHAFASGPDTEDKWLRPSGIQNFRVVRDGATPGPPMACLLRIQMGQHFGGRSVPMLGIAAVGVAPEARGQGVARWMMGQAMQEAYDDGFALSALYASTQGLYRQVGYEQAGYRVTTRVLPHRIDARAREPRVRALTPADDALLGPCYAKYAACFNGMLDRVPYIWRRVRELRDKKYAGFGIDAPGGGLEGYVFLNQTRTSPAEIELDVSDFVFHSARAGQRLLGFLADFSTTTSAIALSGAPLHPALSLMTSHHDTIAKREVWMLRIVDLVRALTERGYSRSVKACLQLNVHDPFVRANDGSWTLSVEHGRAEVRKEALMRPALTCSINALAAIYSGFYTARQAALLGWVEAEMGALDAADAIFGCGGTPWMADFF